MGRLPYAVSGLVLSPSWRLASQAASPVETSGFAQAPAEHSMQWRGPSAMES